MISAVTSLCFSYHGFFKFGFSGDASIFASQEDIAEFANAVMEEFYAFKLYMKQDQI